MEQKVHKNLVQRVPHDSIFPDLQAIMQEAGLEDEQENGIVDKLKRGVYEAPLQILQDEPLRLVHNKLARMVQHDVTLNNAKIVPEDMLDRELKLRILPDTDAIHSKLFHQMEAGDASKLSVTEQLKHSRNFPLKRKQIIPAE